MGTIYEAPTRRRRGRRIALIAGLVLIVLLAGAAVGGWAYYHSVDSKLNRINVSSLTDPKSSPQSIAAGTQNILLLGSDSRNPDTTDGSRTDTIMVAHIAADHRSVQLISIPRDTYVDIPDHGKDKINSAYAEGGADLMVRTVQNFTGLRIDHVALVDFSGFKEIVDALGGIDIHVDQTFTSIHTSHEFVKNADGQTTHMDGATALDYARQRYQFSDGDFTRIAHQHQVIKAVMDKAVSTGTVTDLAKLHSFLSATASAVTVDDTLSPLNLAWALRSITSSDVTFVTNPSAGTPTVDGESVVLSDESKSPELWQAVANDTVTEWVAANPTYVR
ncbi:MAG: LCP family protein [Kribbellaceae bacterium]|nr:LCP family protein [Kribbellaceae bacterium]